VERWLPKLSKKEITKIVDRLVKKTSRWQNGEMFGLRIHHPYDDSRADYPACEIGDILPPSRLWERDHMLEEELDGTSVVGINLRNGMHYEEARREIKEAVKEVLNYVWVEDEDVLLLVKGAYIEDGPDIKEVLLEDPVVVERIELRKIKERRS